MIKDNERRIQLLEIIEENPGIKFREIMRRIGIKNGVLSHHLRRLEKSGTVKVQRRSRETRFYPVHISNSESKIITALRRHTSREIIQELLSAQEGIEFSELTKKISKAPSTISFYLSQLVDDEVVILYISERKRRYKIKDPHIVNKLIKEYHPKLLDKTVSNFEDIINSL